MLQYVSGSSYTSLSNSFLRVRCAHLTSLFYFLCSNASTRFCAWENPAANIQHKKSGLDNSKNILNPINLSLPKIRTTYTNFPIRFASRASEQNRFLIQMEMKMKRKQFRASYTENLTEFRDRKKSADVKFSAIFTGQNSKFPRKKIKFQIPRNFFISIAQSIFHKNCRLVERDTWRPEEIPALIKFSFSSKNSKIFFFIASRSSGLGNPY